MGKTIGLEVAPLHATLTADGTTVEQVLIRLKIADPPGRTRPRLTAALVLDVSWSMEGEPLEHVARSAERLVEILDDDDALGIVAFAGTARVAAPVERLDAEARKRLRRAIAGLALDSATNISAGLAHGVLALPVRRPDERQLLLVMSDGQPNTGTSSLEGLVAETRVIKDKGVAVSTLGFGADHDDDILVAIADAGGGRYAYVNEPRLADASFARALGAQRDVVAEDVSVILAPADGVEIARVLGNPPTSVSAAGLRVRLTDAIAGDELVVIVELRVRAPREPGPWRPLRVTAEWKPLGGAAPDATRTDVDVAVVRGEAGPANVEVAAFAAIAAAGDERAAARALADRRNFAGAAAVLRRAKAAIEATPGVDLDATSGPGAALRAVLEALTDDITAMDNHPSEEAYAQYRKGQQAYNSFAVAGVKGRGGAMPDSAGAEALARQLHGALPAAHLVMRKGGVELAKIPLDRPEILIGRTFDNHVHVPSSMVSMRHSRIQFHDGRFWAFDLGSTNGTRVNGEMIRREHALVHGDVIDFGDVQLEYRDG